MQAAFYTWRFDYQYSFMVDYPDSAPVSSEYFCPQDDDDQSEENNSDDDPSRSGLFLMNFREAIWNSKPWPQ